MQDWNWVINFIVVSCLVFYSYIHDIVHIKMITFLFSLSYIKQLDTLTLFLNLQLLQAQCLLCSP